MIPAAAPVYIDPPTSLATRYLYQGAMLLPKWQKESPVTDQILRGLWACGVTVVAPVGVVYHAAQAARYALESCCNEKASELAKKHFSCLGNDLWVFLMHTTYAGPTSVAALAAGAIFGGLIWAAAAVVVCHIALTIIIVMDGHTPLSEPILWFRFATDPFTAGYHHYFSRKHPIGLASQGVRYMNLYNYKCLVLQGKALDKTLTEDEINRLRHQWVDFENYLRQNIPDRLIQQIPEGKS